jgi:hypothetical protein
VGWIERLLLDFKFRPAAAIVAAGFFPVRRQQGRRAHNLIVRRERMRAQKSMQEGFDTARVVARKAVAKLPESTIRGFHDGRKAGRNFVGNAPHVAGAVVGFVYGAGEAVVGVVAEPVGNLLGWVSSLAYGE